MLSSVQDFNRSGYELCVEIQPKISKVCQSLFVNTKFKKFSVGRFFLDKLGKTYKVAYFSTDLLSTKWLMMMDDIKNGCDYNQAIIETPPNQLSYFIHPQHTNDHLLNAYREQFHFCNGMTIYHRHDQYIDAWEVSMSTTDACSYTINKSFMDYFSKWISHFNERLPTLFDTETIHFVETMDLSFCPLKFFEERLPSRMAWIKENLSLQEFKCFTLCGLGKTMKEIAVNLKLSPRTVEAYLNNVKNKLGINFKSDIIKLYQEIVSDDVFRYKQEFLKLDRQDSY